MQIENNRISVIIPAYNRERTIGYCLDSVLAQSFSPFEVIVVDDCSSDKTVEIVWGYSDPRVQCIVLEKNMGAQAARNIGIRKALGKWIAFQDSDDEWLAEKLEMQMGVLAEVNFNPMTVIHADCYRYDHQTNNRTLWELPLIEGGAVFPLLLKTAGPLFPSILTSKAALKKVGFLDESVLSFQEWDTSIRLARECKFIHIREPLFIYHLHKGETISKNKKREIHGYQYIVDKFRKDILLQCGSKALNTHLTRNAFKALRWGYYADACEILAKTLGNSVRINILKWVIQQKSNLWVYSMIIKFVQMSYCIHELAIKIVNKIR